MNIDPRGFSYTQKLIIADIVEAELLGKRWKQPLNVDLSSLRALDNRGIIELYEDSPEECAEWRISPAVTEAL